MRVPAALLIAACSPGPALAGPLAKQPANTLLIETAPVKDNTATVALPSVAADWGELSCPLFGRDVTKAYEVVRRA